MLVGDVDTLADRIRPVAGQPLTFDSARPHPARARTRDLELGAVLPRARQPLHALLARGPRRRTTTWSPAEADGADAARARAPDPGSRRRRASNSPRSSTTCGPRARRRARTHGRALARCQRLVQLRSRHARRAETAGALVTYSAGERGRRFDIRRERSRDRRRSRSTAASPIASSMPPTRFPTISCEAASDGVLTVTFAAEAGSRAGAVYDVRLGGGRRSARLLDDDRSGR